MEVGARQKCFDIIHRRVAQVRARSLDANLG